MAKFEYDGTKKQKAPILSYPKGYYENTDPLVANNPYLKVVGNRLLIHDKICRGVMHVFSFWREWPDNRCPKCNLPFMVTVSLVPLEPYDDEWNYAKEIFSGGNPQCFCNPKGRKHYKYLNETTQDEPPLIKPFEKEEIEPKNDEVPF